TMYVQDKDNHGQFPPWGLGHGGSDRPWPWEKVMGEDYSNATALLRCPSDTCEFWDRPWGGTIDTYRTTSYASNFWLCASAYWLTLNASLTGSGQGTGPVYTRIDTITQPANTLYWAELAQVDIDNLGYVVADHFHPELWFDVTFPSTAELRTR